MAILDTCYIHRLQEVDNDCEDLLLHVSETYSETCVLSNEQYEREKNPCYGKDHPCIWLEKEISEDEAKAWYYENSAKYNLEKCFSRKRRKEGDFVDVMITALAHKTGNCIVLTCDKGVLFVCRKIGIERRCLKYSLIDVDERFNGKVFSSKEFTTQHLLDNSSDNFCVNFHLPTGCAKCDDGTNCKFDTKKKKYFPS